MLPITFGIEYWLVSLVVDYFFGAENSTFYLERNPVRGFVVNFIVRGGEGYGDIQDRRGISYLSALENLNGLSW